MGTTSFHPRAREREPATSALAVSVVIPTRNAGEGLAEVVNRLMRQTLARDRFEIVIADDGSTDGSTHGLATEDGLVRVSSGPPQNSYAARNRAAASTEAPVIAFCDSDCRPAEDWLEQGLAALEEADLAAGLIRFVVPRRPTLWTLLDMDLFLDQEHAVRAGRAVTANLFVRRKVFEQTGGFDDTLPSHGDHDFVTRCVAAGARLVFARSAVVRHPTSDGGRGILRKVWYKNRWYAARQARAGKRPRAVRFRSLVPIVQTYRTRARSGRSIGLDRRRLDEHGVVPTPAQRLGALGSLYLLLPYLALTAQVRGWLDGRRLRLASSPRTEG